MIKFDSELIRNRLALLNEYMTHLKEMQDLSEKEFLADFRNYSTVERLLQLTIEAFIDIGNHLVAMSSWGKPSNYREIFQILTEHRIFTKEQGKTLQEVIGFLNILVHHYFRIDRRIIYRILQENLSDLETFIRLLIKCLNLEL